jgi:hypothetical protein
MRQAIRFLADDVELDASVGFIGFADSIGERYVWMQPGETSSGLSPHKDEIWLERDDQQWGGSGGRWSITLMRQSFQIDTRGLEWMACDAIEIEYHVDDEKYQSLKSLLQVVMSACPQDLTIRD